MSPIYADAVAAYQAAGWPSVLPVERKELKVKGVTGRQGRMPAEIDYKKWLLRFPEHNAALRLPKYLIGIDVDAYDDKPGAATLAELEERWGELPRTIRSSARIGDPYSGIRFFRVPAEAEVATEFPGIEIIQFHHRYAVVWPSIHPDLQIQYRWWAVDGERMDRVPQPGEFEWLPDGWWDGLRAAAPASGEPGGASGDLQRGAAGTRSTLAALLENPPDGASGRNNWLTKVAGHLAKVIPWQDGYEALLAAVDAGLVVPYESTDAGGIKKLAVSVWDTEQRGKVADDGELPRQETGWLAGDGSVLWVLREVGKEQKTQQLAACSDFDLKVLGKYVDEEAGTHYRLQINSALAEVRYLVEPASLFGNMRALAPRLRALELNIWPVAGDQGAIQSKNPAGRLGHYLSTQAVPRLRIAPCMGWHDPADGFICDEGVITADGLNPHGGWMPDPAIRKRDPVVHHYGFEGDWAAAQQILREVLTFQAEEVTSVFGAWWAAVLVKAQMKAKASLFPFVAIEATSGTGKTEGFFSLMVELNGATKLGSHQTAASFRDSLAANRSGIVWIDDLDDATRIYQDIRTATSEQVRSKKGADHFSTVSVNLVAPVLLTGETLPGLADQTALLDRLIRLDVPPAKDRRSRHGAYPQWDDIVKLKELQPQLWRYSGWYVQKALQFWPELAGEWLSLRPAGSGRHADKLTILRLGARLLELLTEETWHAELVDDWCGRQVAPEGDFLTNRILPELLRDGDLVSHAMGWQPVFVDEEGTVWWHPAKVADAWQHKYKNADARTKGFGNIDTLTRHREAMGVDRSQRRKFAVNRVDEDRRQQNYFPLPPEMSALVFEKAQNG